MNQEVLIFCQMSLEVHRPNNDQTEQFKQYIKNLIKEEQFGFFLTENVVLVVCAVENKKLGKRKKKKHKPFPEYSDSTIDTSSWDTKSQIFRIGPKSPMDLTQGNVWDVQVILHRIDPYNADYFPARVRDMQSLIYCLCRANFTFNLLSQVFDVHEGVKTKDTDCSKSVAAYSQKYGRKKAYSRYVNEMNTTYSSAFAQCGEFKM
ncbi:hypothetical protein CRE_12972 [Caenorhabditis remanei]|uniref:Uncharacterized protein n=1 Tax=Caenorhabditis remanei TaxID=31234 RepID=E3N122_CAERE|nr:hypothetical protein CRE_12972 [Caenorhabditis remanei]